MSEVVLVMVEAMTAAPPLTPTPGTATPIPILANGAVAANRSDSGYSSTSRMNAARELRDELGMPPSLLPPPPPPRPSPPPSHPPRHFHFKFQQTKQNQRGRLTERKEANPEYHADVACALGRRKELKSSYFYLPLISFLNYAQKMCLVNVRDNLRMLEKLFCVMKIR